MDYKIMKHIRKKYKLMIRLLKNLFKKNKKLNLKMNEKEYRQEGCEADLRLKRGMMYSETLLYMIVS